MHTQEAWANACDRSANYVIGPRNNWLLSQALIASQFIEQYQIVNEEAGCLLHETATYLQERARYAEAEPLLLQALRIREQLLGSEHPDVASSLNRLATLYIGQGKYAEAELFFHRALRSRDQQLGPDHPDVASSLNNLAVLYIGQGKYARPNHSTSALYAFGSSCWDLSIPM